MKKRHKIKSFMLFVAIVIIYLIGVSACSHETSVVESKTTIPGGKLVKVYNGNVLVLIILYDKDGNPISICR